MRRVVHALQLLFMLALAGCATIASGTTQAILVDTFNATGATCKGVDKKGREYYWVNTPSSATVQKGDAPLTITCEKPGFKKTIYVADESIVAATFGNIIAGGLVGVLVDATTGAAQEYPTLLRFPMEPDESAPEEAKAAYEQARKAFVQQAKNKASEEK